jgi:site-specific recombinase XerD
MNSKKNTLRNYEYLLTGFSAHFGDRLGESISSEEVLAFLSHHTEGAKQSTKRLRFSLLRSFYALSSNLGSVLTSDHLSWLDTAGADCLQAQRLEEGSLMECKRPSQVKWPFP